MARESSIDQLSAEDKTWLDKRFMDKGFCGYEEIATILQERGYNVSKSSVHRYGQKVEQKLAAVQASTQAAMMIADAAPDDSDMRSSAVYHWCRLNCLMPWLPCRNLIVKTLIQLAVSCSWQKQAKELLKLPRLQLIRRNGNLKLKSVYRLLPKRLKKSLKKVACLKIPLMK